MLEHSNDKLDTIWTKDEDGKDIFLPALSVSPMQVNPHHTNELTGAVDPTAASLSTLPIPALRTGRWSQEEKILFLHGLRRFGKGRWKKMSIYLPHRSLVQIKSHAQKVLKRQDGGEDIFRKLQETDPKLIDHLVVQAQRERDALRAAGVNVNTTKPAKSLIAAAQKSGKQTASKKKKSDGESVIAAAALCQLSSVGADSPQHHHQWGGLDPLDVMPLIDQQESV